LSYGPLLPNYGSESNLMRLAGWSSTQMV